MDMPFRFRTDITIGNILSVVSTLIIVLGGVWRLGGEFVGWQDRVREVTALVSQQQQTQEQILGTLQSISESLQSTQADIENERAVRANEFSTLKQSYDHLNHTLTMLNQRLGVDDGSP